MARIRFRKPKIAVLMSEIISLTIWLFLGSRVLGVLDGLIGTDYPLNITNLTVTQSGCTNASNFEDAFKILGIGYACEDYTYTPTITPESLSNTDGGLLGVIGLVMVVMVLMNFISYN